MDIKRFEVLPIIDSIKTNERGGFQITCVEVNNDDIYLGTLDSFIFCYRNVLQQRVIASQIPQYKNLPSKKSITQLKVTSVLERLICIFDSTLITLNLKSLELNNLRLKNVYSFCMNENPISMDPFSVELCLIKRKSVSICQMQSDKIVSIKEVSIPEQPILVSMDGYFVCIATESNYYMLDWQSGSLQQLCSNEASSFMRPVVKHVSRNEFLINGLSHLGIFVKTSGISERPPINWGMDVQRIAYSYPYILCLRKYSISIISVIDSKLKEEFLFENGVYIDNFDGKILIASNENVYYLRRIPWEEQIESLLETGKSQEAIDLCTTLYESGLISNRDFDYAKLVRVKAGLIELNNGNFAQSQQYLIESEFDIEIFLNCYQAIKDSIQLEPEESEFQKTILEDVKLKIYENPTFYVSFLISYINELISRNKFLYTSNSSKLNTCLLILYLSNVSENYDLIENFLLSDFMFDFKCIEKYLQVHCLYHLLALLYSYRTKFHENAIDLWKKLEKGLLTDKHYTGLKTLCHLLTRCKNSKLILNHIEFLLERNQDKAVQVLIANTQIAKDKFPILEPENVIPILHKYRIALITYMEYLVFSLKIKTTYIHNNLAIIYIEIISLQKESQEEDSVLCESILQKLKNLLETSTDYDAQTVLKHLVKNGLDYESAFLYGKMGNHIKAFELFLYKYMDHDKALKHCFRYATPENGSVIYNTLLDVYLELYHRNGPEITKPLLNFLNHSKCQFDLANTLKRLPTDFPLPNLHRFLTNCARTTFSRNYKSSIAKVLTLSQLERIRNDKRQITRKPVFADRNSICIICNTKLVDSKFVWIPSSECYLHDYCYSSSV